MNRQSPTSLGIAVIALAIIAALISIFGPMLRLPAALTESLMWTFLGGAAVAAVLMLTASKPEPIEPADVASEQD